MYANKSIRAKITLWTGILLSLATTIIIIYAAWSLLVSGVEAAEDNALAVSRSQAGIIKAELETALDAANTLAQVLTSIEDIELSRDEVNAMLKNVLLKNSDFVGVYTLWEPDAFDGRDAEFVNRGDGDDETGRFIPHWSRANEGIKVEPLVNYTISGAGDYYLCPKENKKPCIINPYFYEIQGEDVFITSLVSPIIIKDKFYGIAGIDITIEFLQELADEVANNNDLYEGTAQLRLISHDGTLAGVTNNKDAVGKKAIELDPDFADILPTIQQGELARDHGGEDLTVFVPIKIGDTGTPWFVNLHIPYSKIRAPAYARTYQMIIMGASMLVLALVLVAILTANRIVRPILDLNVAAKRFAGGEWGHTINFDREDELGELAVSFSDMANQIQDVFNNLEARMRQHRSLFEGSREAIIITRPEGEIIEANPAWLTMFSYEAEDLVDMNLKSCYINPDERLDFWLKLEQNGSVENYEQLLQKKDNEAIEVLTTATAQRDNENRMVFQKIMRDVTGKKKEALRMQELYALEHELEIARNVNATLIPPPKPSWEGRLELICYNEPTEEVGGDFFYYTPEPISIKGANSVTVYAIAIGDAEGERLPATLLLGLTMSALEKVVRQVYTPTEMLTQALGQYYPLKKLMNSINQAVQLFAVKFDRNCVLTFAEFSQPADKEQPTLMRVANAGGVKPLVRRANGEVEWVDVWDDPLGISSDMRIRYKEVRVELNDKDMVIFITDGILEAPNKYDRPFGSKRFEQAVEKGSTDSAEAMQNDILATVKKYMGKQHLVDDLTMIVVKI